MRFLLLLLASFSLCAPGSHILQLWQDWKSLYGVSFTRPEDEQRRLQIFSNNDDFIRRHNNDSASSVRLAHNEFSYLTFSEFRARYLRSGPRPARPASPAEPRRGVRKARRGFGVQESIPIRQMEAPSAGQQRIERHVRDTGLPARAFHRLNWAERGAVTPAGRQAGCGACWAFSTIGAIEGAAYVKTGELVPLSVQQMVDCATRNNGCDGGKHEWAFDWARWNGGVCSARSIPYRARQLSCSDLHKLCPRVNGTEVQYTKTAKAWLGLSNSEDMFVEALNRQPIAVVINPSDSVWWQFYAGGVINPRRGPMSCGSQFSNGHGVLAVGYGYVQNWLTRRVTLYWLVKNSWGTSWGQGGFALIERQYRKADQGCGILNEPVYPVV
eukprot:EG_transcript_10072